MRVSAHAGNDPARGRHEQGWLVYNHTPASIRDEIARLCGGEDDTRRSHPALISRKGTVWDAAVRVQPKDGRLPSRLDTSGDYETDGTERQTFRVSVERHPGARRSRTVFTRTETGAACRISNIRQRNWTRI